MQAPLFDKTRLAGRGRLAYQQVMSSARNDLVQLMPALESAARRAGELAMTWFRPGARTSAAVSFKGGGSPVTDADLAVDRFLLEEMSRLLPQAGWLSEETADTDLRLSREALFIVDPIDGTTAFVRGDARWAVSVALVEEGRPVAGVIHAPALSRTYTAVKEKGAFLNGAAIRVSCRAALSGARLVPPRGYSAYFEKTPFGLELAPRKPSLALRLADVAMGASDLAITAPNARDWDIAAADVILTEAGGLLSELDGGPLTYNRATSRRNMLVAAPKALFDESLALAKAAMKEG